MTLRYYVLDTETSDIGPDSGIVEIAWVELDSTMNIIDQVHSRIDPQKPINPAASGVHGITNADVADCPTIEEFFEVVRGSKITGPAVIVGHNVNFDMQFVRPWVEDLHGTICTLRLARRYYPDSPNAKLATLRYYLNLPEAGQAHSAFGDVITTTELLRALVFKTGFQLKELVAIANRPIHLHQVPFGKHKGKRWHEVPADYIRWMSGLQDIDDDLKFTLERIKREAA